MIDQPVVEATGAALPEFDFLWVEDVATPEAGDRDGLTLELLFIETPGVVERFTAGNDRGLGAGPGADLGDAGALVEVGFAFFAREFFDPARGADLTLQFFPVEAEGGVGVGGEFPALAAVVVGEEREAAIVEGFEQDDADAGDIVDGGGERHGVRFKGGDGEDFVKPAVELGDGVGARFGFEEAALGVVFAEFGVAIVLGHGVFLKAGVDDEALGRVAEEVGAGQAPIPEVGGDIGAEHGVELIFACFHFG